MSDIFAAFCSDPQLVELLEACKSGSDLLEILKPRENQHSDILAWCFNAKEGHGQGDAILRDFILAIYTAASESRAGDQLAGNGFTRAFVQAWTPTRVLTTSFATASFFREYPLPSKSKSSTTKGKDRIDVLIVDTENKFVIVVENKAGAKHNDLQLKRYVRGIRSCLLSKPAFAGFKVAFVALDINYDRENVEAPGPVGVWARLNYDWLKPAAKRAELMHSRGNEDAALVLSYCRRQTGWESEKSRSISRLARRIAISHREVVARLRKVRRQLKSPSSWTKGLLNSNSVDGQLLRLSLQNKAACEALIDLPPIQLLHGTLSEHLTHLEDDDYAEVARVKASYRPRIAIHQPEEYWPLYVFVRQVPNSGALDPRFIVRLVWRPKYVESQQLAAVSAVVRASFPGAKNVVTKSTNLMRRQVDSIDEAASVVKDLLRRCEALPLPRQAGLA